MAIPHPIVVKVTYRSMGYNKYICVCVWQNWADAAVVITMCKHISPSIYCARATLSIICFSSKWHESWTIDLLLKELGWFFLCFGKRADSDCSSVSSVVINRRRKCVVNEDMYMREKINWSTSTCKPSRKKCTCKEAGRWLQVSVLFILG